jgi:hypothetical protein
LSAALAQLPTTEWVADRELEAATDALAEELRSFPSLAQRTAKGSGGSA